MVRKSLVALVAGSGLILSASAASAKPAGGIWSDNSPSKTSSKPKPKADKAPAEPTPGEPAAAANADADLNAPASSAARANSQGPGHANVQAIERANENSVLAEGSVAASALPGLANGVTVKTSAGTSLGTVSQIVTADDGSIRLVVVTDGSGKTYRLTPSQLSIAGGIVTTTQTDFGG